MAKRPSLADSLHQAANDKEKESLSQKSSTQSKLSQEASPRKQSVPPSRQGKKAVTGHFDPAVSRQLKQLALDRDTTVQSLLTEALNILFEKYGRNPIA
ncbi:MAG: ribbon-helix-helix domain-containing protein [Synechococcus sp.]